MRMIPVKTKPISRLVRVKILTWEIRLRMKVGKLYRWMQVSSA